MAGAPGSSGGGRRDGAGGVEVALGIVRDPTFGPLVLVAAGGVLVELLHDRALGASHLWTRPGGGACSSTAWRCGRCSTALRGAPAADVDALAHAVSRLSVLADDLGDVIAALDVNPVIVSPDGCVAVDALVVARQT